MGNTNSITKNTWLPPISCIYLYQTNKTFMTLFIILVVVAAGVAYLITKNKAHLSSIEDSIKSAVDKVETAVAPAIEEAKEIVAKAETIAPKNEIIAEIKATEATVETTIKEAVATVKTEAKRKPAQKSKGKK
jgi:archaellum component FlaG (FlaF/FlaG flagellin family)